MRGDGDRGDDVVDGAKDTDNLPLDKEPATIREDVALFRAD